MTVDEEVRAVNDVYERALAAEDVATLVSLHTDDARLMMAGQPLIQGRSAIEKLFGDWLKEAPVSTRFETDEILADGDLVIDIGHTIEAGRRGKYVVVHRRGPEGKFESLSTRPPVTSDIPPSCLTEG